MTHNVHKIGPWFKALAARVAEAKRGDVIVVDDLEMMQYACFGIESRGFVTHDREKGIVVHLAEGASPTGIEKGTMRGTGPSMQNIPRDSSLGSMFTEAQRQAARTILGIGVNRNEDSWNEESLRAGNEVFRQVNEMFAEHVQMPGPVTRTTVKPNDPPLKTMKDVAEGIEPVFRQFRPRWVTGGGTGRSLSQDYTMELPLSGYKVHAKAPSGQITVTCDGKPVPFENVPRDALREIVAFANNPLYYLAAQRELVLGTGRQTGKSAMMEEIRRASLAAGQTVQTVSGRTPEPSRMLTGDWGYGPLTQAEPTKCSFNYALELLSRWYVDLGDPKTAKELRAEMRKAYEQQAAITINLVPEGEVLLVPPDLYDAGQKFVCQQCGQEYVYGLAKEKMEFNTPLNVKCRRYNPLVFCCVSHEDEYLRKNGRYPAVGAEILLSPPVRCNLLDHYKRSEGAVVDPLTGKPVGSVVTESFTTPADVMSVDKVAGLLGFEVAGPTAVVEQKVADVKPGGAQET